MKLAFMIVVTIAMDALFFSFVSTQEVSICSNDVLQMLEDSVHNLQCQQKKSQER